jgi:hypothetical protein
MKNNTSSYIEQDNLDKSLIEACKVGDLAKVKYLLTSDELSQHADISCINNRPLFMACAWEHKNIIDYLLFSPELKKHADVHDNKDIIFNYLLESRKDNILQYLILDMNVQKNKNIERALKNFPNPNVKNWFKVREWNKEVIDGLEPTNNNEKVKKPKI